MPKRRWVRRSRKKRASGRKGQTFEVKARLFLLAVKTVQAALELWDTVSGLFG
ncbi:hypothetical protein GCM10027199_15640 [Amycolatopsis magusensis]